MAAVHAELAGSGSPAAAPGLGRARRGARGPRRLRARRRRSRRSGRVHHLLRHHQARAQSDAGPRQPAALIGGGYGHGLRYLELRVPPHVADHVHADALIEQLLQLFGQRDIFHCEVIQQQTEFGEHGPHGSQHALAELRLVRGQIDEVDAGVAEHVGHLAHNSVAQLPFKLGHGVGRARTAHLLVEDFRIGNAVGVNAECAHTHRAEFLIANRNRLRRAPLLVGLQTRGEEVNVGLKRRFERLVPVHQVGEDGQRVGAEGIETRPEDIRDAALVHEHRRLGIAHGELAAILDFHVLHGIAVSEHPIAGLGPLDYIDELLGEKAHIVPETVYGSY